MGKILHITAGQALSVQYHEVKDETVYLLTGEMRYWVQLPGETELRDQSLKPGDAFRITPGTVHYMEAITDCDVLEADGGTRTASITGAWVALAFAIQKLVATGKLATAAALRPPVAAVSVGIVDGEVVLDLPYVEDSRAEVDMNVVGDEAGALIEVQGTAEHGTFDRGQLTAMLDLAAIGLRALTRAQREVVA